MSDETNYDQLVGAVLFELQIKICISKCARTPMLEGYDIAWLRCEFATDLATPRTVLKILCADAAFCTGAR